MYVLVEVSCTRMVKFKSRISHMSTCSTVILLYKGNCERMTVLWDSVVKFKILLYFYLRIILCINNLIFSFFPRKYLTI